jgi:hypothetical protein
MYGDEDKIPDAESAAVAQKTQKRKYKNKGVLTASERKKLLKFSF